MTDSKERVKTHKILVVIPTYNNEKTLAGVIADVKRYSDSVLVVNDGSTDGTQSIIEQNDVESISYIPNRGKGYAIKQALGYASSKGYEYILTIDSDGQHFASDIISFVDAIEDNAGSLIIGSRNLRAENMASKNTFANKFSNFWYKVETAQSLSDTQSGFRLYPVKALDKVRFVTNRYEFEVEVIVRAAWKEINVFNIPIQVYYPPKEERVSHFKPLKDFTRISILNSLLVVVALLYYYPWKFLNWFTKENIKNFVRDNITHSKESTIKIAAAMGLGVLFGIIPIWGYQMIAAAFVAHLLKLNKVITLISSNISVPPMIPFILYGSYYTGGKLLGTNPHISFADISIEKVTTDMLQYVLGASVFAIICGFATIVVSFLVLSIIRPKK